MYPESCSGGRLEEFCEAARVQDLQEILTWGENVQDTGKGCPFDVSTEETQK